MESIPYSLDRRKHRHEINGIDISRMSVTEKIKKQVIQKAFEIRQSEGKPLNGKHFKNIQRLISERNVREIRKLIKTETHWPTRAMLIRNLAKLEHQQTKNKE